MKQNKKTLKAIETARNARKLKLRSVMETAWELYRDTSNDLNCMALALKCSWDMHTDTVNAIGETPADLQEIYSAFPIARAYLKRGGGKNRVNRNADGTLTDFWFDTRDICQSFLSNPDSKYLVCHAVWALNQKRVLDGKEPRPVWQIIGRVAERVYMREMDVHRLTRDVVNADGIVERKRIRTCATVSTSALNRKNADGEEFNLLDTARYAVNDNHDDLLFDDLQRVCAHDDTDRVILRLKRDGVKGKEIADFIGISAPAVTKRLNRMFDAYKKANA